MKIKDIFPELKREDNIEELVVKGVNEDSRLAEKGDIFFVRERKNFDIFSVLPALSDKIAVFVCQNEYKDKLRRIIKEKPVIFVKNIDKEFRRTVDLFYGFKKDNFKFIGVTGTNGKTTVTHFIYSLLKALGQSASLIGTVNYIIGSKVYDAVNTTPDYLTLRKLFREIKISDKNIHFIVMEVSSHGIAVDRIKGIEFASCIFTNLTRDHLDYHKTMADYFAVKRKLFRQNKTSPAVINVNDPYGREILREVEKGFSYGIDSPADFKAQNIRLGIKQTQFDLVWNDKKADIKIPVLGTHNISNVLAAIAALVSVGFPLDDILKKIAVLKGVNGRLQEVVSGVFVDYAHTPDALERVLLALKEIGYKNIICVFGCGGDRDSGKRPLMGEIASNLAEFSFITSDNPRSEKPTSICRQVAEGFKKNNYLILEERRTAIEKAIRMKEKYKNSCILVAGKGHEEYQIVRNNRIPFSDKKVIKAALTH